MFDTSKELLQPQSLLRVVANSASCLLLLCPYIYSQSATAQILPDSTLPSNSGISVDGNTITINGGTTVGGNLFHSFQEFSLPTDNTAYFDNAVTIENILTRVTGSNISNIDGLIKANGSANLFLINPNGIVFGENASLDIGGSFLGSTANSIAFQDGSQFSAVNPEAPPLLTINMPVGLNLSNESGEIVVRGVGNQVVYDFEYFITDKSDRPEGFAVSQGQTLALVGNGVTLEGGNITAREGNIELGSVASGTVGINQIDGLELDYSQVAAYSDLNLSQGASADVSGNSGGIAKLTGKNIILTDGSGVFADTEGDGTGGLIEANATEAVELIGDNPDTAFWSILQADTAEYSTGSGGSITVNTAELNILDGGQISSVIYGDGDGGTITVNAEEVNISGFAIDEFYDEISGYSGIYGTAEFIALGTGSSIEINTQNLGITDEGTISTATWGDGNAGNIGITTNSLYQENGGVISSDTYFGFGNAGNISITAKNIEVVGSTDSGEVFATLISSLSDIDALGNGGNVEIVTESLKLKDGAQIQSRTSSEGSAGNISITADSISVEGFLDAGKSAILSSATEGTGNGGSIDIQTRELQIRDGGTISASNFATRNPDIAPGTGNAGNINITADRLSLSSKVAGEQSIINAATFEAGGGNINIAADTVTATDNSLITASTQGTGNGGSIAVAAENINLRDRSSFNSSTSSAGNGGEITFNSDLLNITSRSEITTSSTGTGQAGNITLNSNAIRTNRGRITATSQESGGGNITLNSELIRLRNNSTVSTSVFDSTGGGGDISISSEALLASRNSDIRANAVEGAGGNISIATEVIFTSLSSDIDASSQFGIDGVVEITTPDSEKQITVTSLPEEVSDPNQLIAATCPVSRENVLVVAGKGGLSENPQSYLMGQALWQDLRSIDGSVAKTFQSQPAAEINTSEVTEANGWTINKGSLELIARSSSATDWYSATDCRDLSQK